jgi:acyl-CoA thioesterase
MADTKMEKVRAHFEEDKWLVGAGIEIDEAADGYSLLHMNIELRHFNAGGVVQGGAIFTLADSAFAVASNYKHLSEEAKKITVAQSTNISFLSPPKGKKLIAKANRLHGGNRIGVCLIEITDELGTKVATFTGNSYTIDLK